MRDIPDPFIFQRCIKGSATPDYLTTKAILNDYTSDYKSRLIKLKLLYH